MSQLEPRQRTYIDPSRAEALLFPIAAFLYAGGWTKRSAAQSFSRAFDWLVTKKGARQLKTYGNPAPYAEIVSLWIRDPKFIDKFGQARVLHLNGRNSFKTLVRKACGIVDPQDALSVLTHFRNVRLITTVDIN